MIRLDDLDAWAKLEHGYGRGDSQVPDLLRKLEKHPKWGSRNDPFADLFGCICHQGTVYPSSFAAVPHIARIVERNPKKTHSEYFALPLLIEIGRQKFNVKIPKAFKAEYVRALDRLVAAGMKLKAPKDEALVRSIACLYMATRGQWKLAEITYEMHDDTLALWEDYVAGSAGLKRCSRRASPPGPLPIFVGRGRRTRGGEHAEPGLFSFSFSFSFCLPLPTKMGRGPGGEAPYAFASSAVRMPPSSAAR